MVWVPARTMSCLDSAEGQEALVAVVEMRFPGFGVGGVVPDSGGRQNISWSANGQGSRGGQ